MFTTCQLNSSCLDPTSPNNFQRLFVIQPTEINNFWFKFICCSTNKYYETIITIFPKIDNKSILNT